MKFLIVNIDKIPTIFDNEIDFIKYVKSIFNENGAPSIGYIGNINDGKINYLKEPQTLSEAENYITQYCNNLTLLQIGNSVLVPDPNFTDIYNHSFVGTITDFSHEYIIVTDDNGNDFLIEPERIKIIAGGGE